MNALVHVAEQELRNFGARTRDEAALILPVWRHNGSLSEEDRVAVLARFDDQPWPASVRHKDRTAENLETIRRVVDRSGGGSR